VVAGVCVSVQAQNRIGIKFGQNGNGNVQSAAVGAVLPGQSAGAPGYAQVNWNIYGRFGNNSTNTSGTNAYAIYDSGTNDTHVTIQWDASGQFGVQGTGTVTDQGDPDKNLMDAYADSNGNGNVNITNSLATGLFAQNNNNKPLVYLSGLQAWLATQSATAYDVVMYTDGDNAAGRCGEYWLQYATGPTTNLIFGTASPTGTPGVDMTTHMFVRDFNNFTVNPVYQQVPMRSQLGRSALSGNYIVFTHLTADSFLLRTSEFNTRSGVTALQIVPRTTPLPAQIDPLPTPTTYAGANASFRPVIGGVVPMAFQWQRDGTNLVDGGNVIGSTSNVLSLTTVSLADQASYSLVVSNASGMITSTVAPLIVVSPASGSFAEQVVNSGAVAYWRLNETTDPSGGTAQAIDSIGGFNAVYGNAAKNGFNSIVGPTPTDWPGFESGNFGLQCFNSSTTPRQYPDSYVSWAVGAPLNLNTNTVTISAWIYPTAAQVASTAIFFTRGSGTDVSGLGFSGNANTLNNLGYTWAGNGNTFNWTLEVTNYNNRMTPLTNAWNHVALVISPSNAIIYLNNVAGQLSVTNIFNHTNLPWASQTYIGDDPSSTGTPQNRAFQGSIDEVAVFNRSLSGSEILNLYKKGLQITTLPPVIVSQPLPSGLLEGRNASFNVIASGDATLTYQWRRDGTNLSDIGNILGSATPALAVSSVAIANDAANYDVVIGNLAGFVTSTVAPLSIVVSNSTPTPYETKIRALNPLAYWRLNEPVGSPYSYDYWGGIVGVNEGSVTLGVNGPQPPNFSGIESTNTAASFVSIPGGDVATGVSILNNRPAFSVIGWFQTAGIIGNRKGLFGQNDVCEFGFLANGTDGQAGLGFFTPRASVPLINQSTNVIAGNWYLIAAVATGTNVSLFLASTNGVGGIQVVQTSTAHAATTNYGFSADPFRIAGGGVIDTTDNYFDGVVDEVAVFGRGLSSDEISSLFGAALSGGDLPPTISIQPVSKTLYQGQSASFSVSALGTGPLKYRWRTNGVPISDGGNVSGTTNTTLTITNVQGANSANYDVVITNRAGAVTSLVATLNVVVPTSAYESAVIALNPVAYYRLNEFGDPSTNAVAYDYWGGHNGNYQVATSNAFNGVFGPLPPEFTFEPTNGAVAVQSPVANSFVTAPFGSLSTNTVTMCMWVKPTGTMDAIAGLLMNRNAGVAGGFGYIGGNLTYTWNNNSAATYNATYGNLDNRSDLIPPLDKWSFVALVVQPSQAVIYMINDQGTKSATNILAHTSDVFGNNWQIGHDGNDGATSTTRNFNGSIDEVAVFSYALTPTQLNNLYLLVGPPAVTLSIVNAGPNNVVTWSPAQGTLLQSANVTGPWTPIPTATSPYTVPATNSATYYRVQVR
jgi:hypothetical protein